MRELLPGTEIMTGWKAVRLIGSGSYGKVYEAERNDGDGRVFRSAIKVIGIPQTSEEYESYIDDGYDEKSITTIFRGQVETIVREFAMMSQFKGVTNIVSCEDYSIIEHEDGHSWDVIIRMELLTSLPELLKQKDLSEKEVVQFGIDICTALELCAKKNVTHRDIKPQNVFINEFGNFKLGDFGVARTIDHATHATRIGTTNYMAPEVYFGRPYDARIDQYSLGLMMYWLLNERRLPFLPLPPAVETAKQRTNAQERRMSGEAIPRPAHGCDVLAEIVLKACSFDPAGRYGSATEMKYALLAAMASAKDETVTVGLAHQSRKAEENENSVPPVTPPSADGESGETIGVFLKKPAKREEYEPEPAEPEPIETKYEEKKETKPKVSEDKPEEISPEDEREMTIGIFGRNRFPDKKETDAGSAGKKYKSLSDQASPEDSSDNNDDVYKINRRRQILQQSYETTYRQFDTGLQSGGESDSNISSADNGNLSALPNGKSKKFALVGAICFALLAAGYLISSIDNLEFRFRYLPAIATLINDSFGIFFFQEVLGLAVLVGLLCLSVSLFMNKKQVALPAICVFLCFDVFTIIEIIKEMSRFGHFLSYYVSVFLYFFFYSVILALLILAIKKKRAGKALCIISIVLLFLIDFYSFGSLRGPDLFPGINFWIALAVYLLKDVGFLFMFLSIKEGYRN